MSYMVLTLSLAAWSAAPASPLPTTLDLSTIRALPVQHDGRWPPLDTVARNIVWQVTGDVYSVGRDPVLLLLAWTFDPATWRDQPLIRISNPELRWELELPRAKEVFSFTDLVQHEPLHDLVDGLAHIERGRKLNPLESEVSEINGKLNTLQEAFADHLIRPIPHPEDPLGTWRPMGALGPRESEQVEAVREAWALLGDAFLADDAAGFSTQVADLKSKLSALPTAHQPDEQLVAKELHYNRLRPYLVAWIIMMGGALLSAVACFARHKAVDALAVVALVAGFAVLSYGLWLRWQIAGRIPAANMFESLLFLSWGAGAFAIVAMLFLHNRVVPLTASFMGAMALLLAERLPMNPFIRPIVPVLQDTIWMSVHVPVIMVSYSVLTLGVLIAHGQLVLAAVAPNRRDLAKAVDSWHYWYIHVGTILLLAGIVTGSMWGASSWGRYWGWDPKEVWSLVALVGYLAILHVRIDRQRVPAWAYVLGFLMAIAVFVFVARELGPLTLKKGLVYAGTAVAMVVFVIGRGHLAIAVKSIVAFWMIVMTYLGVNYVLGTGLHSYGFGTGAVVQYMFLFGAIDLVLIVLCSLAYLLRREPGEPGGATATTVTARL